MIGLDLKSCSQANLEDDGRRSWKDEIKIRLDEEYPGWQSPKRTTMVPPVFSYKNRNPDNGDHTEKKVYDLLQEFGEVQKEGMFVVHSAKFREKIQKWNESKSEEEKVYLTGEHDFVVIHPLHGIIYFQVKAAPKKSREFSKAKSQLEKDQECLQNFCAKHLTGNSAKKRQGKDHLYNSLGFVVMPNCPRPADWETNYGIFKEDCETVESFAAWWKNNISDVKLKGPPDSELYKCLVMRLVGMSHCSPCLSNSIDNSHKVMVFKTNDQLKVLLDTTTEQWITGPAGSGKTWLLIEKVKILARKAIVNRTKERILVVCYNKPLSKMLGNTFKEQFLNQELSSVVEVKRFGELIFSITERYGEDEHKKVENVKHAVECLERGSPYSKKYDHIFVDECQDLFGVWPIMFQKLCNDDDDDDGGVDRDGDVGVDDESVVGADEVGDDDDDDDDDDGDDDDKESDDACIIADVDDGDIAGVSESGIAVVDNSDDATCSFRSSNDKDVLPESKHKWFFYDTNQYLGFSERQYQQHKKTLKKSTKLTQVLRNTGHIFEQSKKYFKSNVQPGESIKLGHQEWGLKISWDRSLPKRQGAEVIARHVNQLRLDKVQDKDICVLVENTKIRDELSEALKQKPFEVESQNAEMLFEENGNKVVVESVRRFKGLEAKVVLLYNPGFFVNKSKSMNKVRELLYTAVSRCLCYLVVITSEKGYKALNSSKGVIEGTIRSQRHSAPAQSLRVKDLESENTSQMNSFYIEPFGKGSIDSQYESGPPEDFLAKRYKKDEDKDLDETAVTSVILSHMQEKQYLHQFAQHEKRKEPKRPLRVNGSSLLEPGSKIIPDKIRENMCDKLFEVVKQSLPSSSAMDQSGSHAREIVSEIEYQVYFKHRNDHSKYGRELRQLKVQFEEYYKKKEGHKKSLLFLKSCLDGLKAVAGVPGKS